MNNIVLYCYASEFGRPFQTSGRPHEWDDIPQLQIRVSVFLIVSAPCLGESGNIPANVYHIYTGGPTGRHSLIPSDTAQ